MQIPTAYHIQLPLHAFIKMPALPGPNSPQTPYSKGARSLRSIALHQTSQKLLDPRSSVRHAHDIYSSLPPSVQKDLFVWLLFKARWAEGTKDELELLRQLEQAVIAAGFGPRAV
ncbi:uncharacterized protein AB675_931 [Cyphellophora attinorum]|uniref:Uncharacterized protein n=1 Tax=Cyphellophora attinorum TaxID=1664694 RepID=A0A0N1P4G2_9EURO|nr:uncharacterized protein AB675_931 [Phialophora attinorum]KPI45644.1 hypothetical protein AB675_931 [Phialophora attinorum]